MDELVPGCAGMTLDELVPGCAGMTMDELAPLPDALVR